MLLVQLKIRMLVECLEELFVEGLEEQRLASSQECVISEETVPESPSLKESCFPRGCKCHRVEIEQIVFTSRKWLGFHFICIV